MSYYFSGERLGEDSNQWISYVIMLIMAIPTLATVYFIGHVVYERFAPGRKGSEDDDNQTESEKSLKDPEKGSSSPSHRLHNASKKVQNAIHLEANIDSLHEVEQSFIQRQKSEKSLLQVTNESFLHTFP